MPLTPYSSPPEPLYNPYLKGATVPTVRPGEPVSLFNPYLQAPVGPDPSPAPAEDITTPDPIKTGSTPLDSGPLIHAPVKPTSAEALIQGSMDKPTGLFSALGSIAQFGEGTYEGNKYGKAARDYQEAPFEELRKAIADGTPIDTAMKNSRYPEMFKLWLAREQASVKNLPNSYDEYLHTLGPGELPSGPAYNKWLTEQGAAKSTKFTLPNGIPLPALDPGKAWRVKDDGSLYIDPETHQPEQVDVKGTKGATAAAEKTRTGAIYSDFVTGKATEVLKQVARHPNLTTGVAGDILSHLYGPARDVAENLKTIKSQIVQTTLQKMRESSPTGGALGSVTTFEEEMLGASFGSLSQAQSFDQFRQNLRQFKRLYAAVVGGVTDPKTGKVRVLQPGEDAAVGAGILEPALGLPPLTIDEMTDDEVKALAAKRKLAP